MGWDVKDRKMQLSKAMDSTSELQGVTLKEINEGSCKTKRVRCPNASTSPNDPIIKAVNPSFKKYPKHLGIKGALCLKEHLSMFLNWPESVRKKRSSSGHIQLSDTPENTLGLALATTPASYIKINPETPAMEDFQKWVIDYRTTVRNIDRTPSRETFKCLTNIQMSDGLQK